MAPRKKPAHKPAEQAKPVEDAAAAQPSDPTRAGGYRLVEGQGWVPDTDTQDKEGTDGEHHA